MSLSSATYPCVVEGERLCAIVKPMDSGVEDVGDWAARGVVGDNEVDNNDNLFMVVFIVIQLVMQRNRATLAVLNAAASSCSAAHPEMGEVLLLLARGFLHSVSLVSAAMDSVNKRWRRRSRSMWVLDRHGGTWKDLQKVGEAHDKVFVRFCRLPQPLFYEVAQRIAPHIQRKLTNWRQLIPVAQKFACALIRWATGGYYRQTSHEMGMGLASELRSNEDVADALIKEYGHLIRFPEGRRLQEVMDAFDKKGFPGCVSAIDGTHLYIEKPKNERAECYYDRTRQFSLMAQVVCDHECQIQDVFAGCPGSVHDSRVVRISHMYKDAQDGRGIFHGGTSFLHDGTPVRGYVIGYAGYPLLPWLMTPVGGDERTPQEVNFDDCHTLARSCNERTFALLKGVWRNFLRRQIDNMKTIMKEFMVVCILHNMMVDMRIDVDLDDLDSDDDDDQANSGNFRCRRRPRVHQAVQQPRKNRRDDTYGSAEGRAAKARLISHDNHHVRVYGRPPANPWRQARAAP
ncbi:hypothetical protein CBR_g10927 [Chara braunii]|uniref:DDE Tnp4 domain-containing protein n=1 Tax=Chara braunii TaxID=69332 RepID=A0A388KPQ8_CHABU|nr:hypothetical protein CBR_g10927 [Chara braunii]|eukprot:GBG71988.1 hypothetical protein CBR_g10927 [Chara braunii]